MKRKNTKESVPEGIMTQIRYVLFETYFPVYFIFSLFSYLDIISFFRLFGVSKAFYSFIQQVIKECHVNTKIQLAHGSLSFRVFSDSNGFRDLAIYVPEESKTYQLGIINMSRKFQNPKFERRIVEIKDPSDEKYDINKLISTLRENKTEDYYDACGMFTWKYPYYVHINDFTLMKKISALFSKRIPMVNIYFANEFKSLLEIPVYYITYDGRRITMNVKLQM
jgi:hypothetical protein